jgi:hypothetical protein
VTSQPLLFEFKVKVLPDSGSLVADARYYVKPDGATEITEYITDGNAVAYPSAATAQAAAAAAAATTATAAATSASSAAAAAAAALATLNGEAVRYDAAQSLTSPQKAQAQSNMGLGSAATHPSTDFDAVGAGTAAVATHVGLSDPHTQYHNNTRGDARYAQLGAAIDVLADSSNFVRMTPTERSNLATAFAVAGNFRGSYSSLAALATAIPAGSVGAWAILTHGSGSSATIAVWDTDNSPNAWVDSASAAPTTMAWSSITSTPTSLSGYGITGVVAADISNASANGRSLITAANYAAMITLLGAMIKASAATLLTGTDDVSAPTPLQIWTAAAEVAVAYASTVTLNLNSGINFGTTLTGNITIANPTNQKPGQSGSYVLTQDATGSRIVTFGSNFKFVGGVAPTLSTTANAVDVLFYYVRSSGVIVASLSKAIA